MSLLKEQYKIDEDDVKGDTGPLIVPETVFFSFDFDDISKEHNYNTTVFWNFGDFGSEDNEIVVSTSSNSMVKHVYKNFGWYHVHCIGFVNGVPFHHEREVEIKNTNNNILFGNNQSVLFGDYTNVNYA